MAIVVSRPARRLARIPPARTYEGIASRYADIFRAAMRQQEENEVNLMILQWQRGEITFDELKRFLEQKIKEAPEGSSRKVEWLNTLTKLEAQHKRIWEAEQEEKVARKRAELLERYMEGGITPKEQLAIVQELKKVADPDSDTYRDLLAEEAQIRTSIARKGAAEGGRVAAKEAAKELARLNAEMRINLDNYRSGLISGTALDQAIVETVKEAQQVLENAAARGASISRADYTIFDPYLGREVEMDTVLNSAQQRLTARSRGLMMDVVDRAGNLVPITLTELANDVIRNPLNPRYQRAPYVPAQDETGLWKLTDPVTGETLKDEKGNEMVFNTREGAATTVKQLFPGYEVVVRTDQGLERWFYDPETNAFSPQGEPNRKFMAIPSTPEQRTLFEYKRPERISDEEFSKLVKRGQEMFIKMGGMPQVPRLEFEAPKEPFGPKIEPEKKGFVEKTEEFLGKIFKPTKIGKTEVFPGPFGPVPKLSLPPARKLVSGLGTRLGEALRTAIPPLNLLRGVSTAVSPAPTRAFEMPEIKIPEIKIRGFTLPDIKITPFTPSPTVTRSTVTTPTTRGPILQPSVGGFGERIKSFGRRIIGGIKSLLGFGQE